MVRRVLVRCHLRCVYGMDWVFNRSCQVALLSFSVCVFKKKKCTFQFAHAGFRGIFLLYH